MSEKRFPAKGVKATLHPILDGSNGFFLRIYDEEFGWKDFSISHYDLEIIIDDNTAEFVETDKGNFLDYSLESMEYKWEL